jgi:lysophospholipase L1-like esterase
VRYAREAGPRLPVRSGLAARRPQLRMAIAGRVMPGGARVRAQVPVFAGDWRSANAAALEGSGPLWVALGDSMSQGIGARSIRGGWVGQLYARLLAEGRPVRLVNLSATGARVHDIAGQQLPQLAALDVVPALVTVLAGANDMFPRSRWASATASYQRILEVLPPRSSVVGTMPRRNGGAAAINALIDDAASRGDIRVADMRGMTIRSLIGTRAEDHFHPNERGYADIARRFSQAVDRSLLIPGQPGC